MTKRIGIVLIVLIVLFILTCIVLLYVARGCGVKKVVPEAPNVLFPAIMIDDILYGTTGKVVAIDIDEAEYLGRISSVVDIRQLPTENGQGNLALLEDAPYAKYEEGLVVLMEGKWILFEIRDVRDD